MEKPKKESVVKDYTTVEGQLKMLRALLLVTIWMLALISIRCHNQYLELKEMCQLLAESDRLLFESDQQLLESDRLLFESDRLILEQHRKMVDLIQGGILEAFGIKQPVSEDREADFVGKPIEYFLK